VGWQTIVAIIDEAAKKAGVGELPASSDKSRPPRRRQNARSSEAIAAAPNGKERADGAPVALAPASTDNSAGAAPRRGEDRLDDGGPPDSPRSLGYSVEALNREYALVKVGAQAVIFQENPSARLVEHQVRMLGIEAFKTWFRNKFTEVRGSDGKIKRVTWANAWLDSSNRRQYEGIEFFPDPNNAPGSPNYLNLWSGFAVTPAAKPDWRCYKTFRDHLLNNICRGDPGLFKYVFGWIAHMMQRPRERLGIALVLRGKMGTGKTKVGEIIGSLFPRHYFLVDDPRYVTGQFNVHMASCKLLQADEAVWAGDKAAEGRLKGLVTAPTQQIEAKGIDPIRLPNYVCLIMTSNEEWVAPAGKDERRFAVLDVDPRCAQNHEYFADMDREMANGGLAHLLGDLLAFDLNSVDLRHVPRTDALLEQKIRSLDPIDSWWLDRLTAGTTTRNSDKWEIEVACDALYSDYIASAEQIGVRRKQPQHVFGTKLKRLVPTLDRTRPRKTIETERGIIKEARVHCYVLPSLATARDDFERAVNQRISWPKDGAGEPAAVDPMAARDGDAVDF
jgi:hypothetical protein